MLTRKTARVYQHRNTTAEVGYFSSSPKLFQQVIYLLQEKGFTPTFKRAKPHLQMKGREQLEKMSGLVRRKGRETDKLILIITCEKSSSKTFKSFGEMMTVPVKAIEIIKSQ